MGTMDKTKILVVLCHNVTQFSLWQMIINIDNITRNQKTIAGKENLK